MPKLTKYQQNLIDLIETYDVVVVKKGDKFYTENYSKKKKDKPTISNLSENIIMPLYVAGVFEADKPVTNKRGTPEWEFVYRGAYLENYINSKEE